MLTFFRRRPHAAVVVRDAERMIRELGHTAYSVAGEMSWREDAGLITSRRAGHWHDVQQEIGRRVGHAATMPTLRRDGIDETTARLQ